MADTIRIGVLGVGYWGPNLVRVFSQNPGSEVVLVCDEDEAKLDRLRPTYRETRFTSDADDVFGATDLDAVIVALPASLHYEFGLKALEAGKHAFIEKPLALTARECRHLIETAVEGNRVLMVGHTFEYNTAVQKVKEIIDSGELGRVFHIFCQRLNLGQVRSDVDALWNLAPHDISIILYWLRGEKPKWVSAQGFDFLQDGVADMGTILMEFSDGTVAQIVVSWLSPDKIRKIMVVGSKKMVIYDDVSSNAKVQVFDKGVDIENEGAGSWTNHENFGEFQLRLRTGDLVVPRIDFIEPLRVESDHFIDCIANGKKPVSDGESGLRVTQVLEAASLSMERQGVRVFLDELSA